jgi:hypothetical protein
MKAIKSAYLAAFFLLAPFLTSQASIARNISARPLTPDQLAIYQDFLSHYEDFEQISNLLGMQPLTVPFKADEIFGSERSLYGPKGCLHDLTLEPQSDAVHHLPAEIMQFGTLDSVTRRITAAAKLVPQSKLSKGRGPDGYVLTKFTLSEIAFDMTHQYGVFVFSAACGCKGGQGGMILYERRNGKWKPSTTRFCGGWEG